VDVGKFLLVIIIFAALVYALLWLFERRRGRGTRAGRRTSPPRPMPRSSAPDDDEDFLRDLNRRNRRKDQDRPSGDSGAPPPE
jgi:hypothetical protein